MISVPRETRVALADIAAGRTEAVRAVLELPEDELQATGLDELSLSLIRLAVLIALDGPPASYAWQVAEAIESGATPEQILDVLRAVAPQVGAPRVIAAAPELMLALGLTLPEGPG
jgi:alkylhydroperoxidase/carboxymuconolactone decarboxylase family protein YurZ